jgi:3-dehydroquinate synthase
MKNHFSIKLNVPFIFNVIFGRNFFSSPIHLENALPSPEKGKKHKLIFFVEKRVASLFPSLSNNIKLIGRSSKKIEIIGEPIILPGGEQNKNIGSSLKICSILSKHKICRQSFVSVIGGGAFLDTACFAASIAHRGIRQIRFPTTVVSQCDSGIGVKNSVNMFGKKNYAGTFTPPYLVINDFDFIATLDRREMIAGSAEAIKVALIKDTAFFELISKKTAEIKNGSLPFYGELIRECAKLHAEHIQNSGDPFEFGSARPLDFGHWIAHKLETMSEGQIRHGEAVAIGIASDSFSAARKGFITELEFEKIIKTLLDCALPVWHKLLTKKKNGRAVVLDGIEEFREHLGGKLHITIPHGIGQKIEVHEMDEKTILESFAHLNKFSKR